MNILSAYITAKIKIKLSLFFYWNTTPWRLTEVKIVKFVLVFNYLSTIPWRHMRVWRYPSTIIDLGTRWKRMISFTPRPLYPHGNRLQYPQNRRLGELQDRCGRCGEVKNFAPPEIEPWPSSSQPAAIPTELSRPLDLWRYRYISMRP
jgi:hypothetical protein